MKKTYRSYIPTHLVRWVHGNHSFEVTDTCFEQAVICGHVRLCNYMIRKTSLLNQPSHLAQKLQPGQPEDTLLKSVTQGAYNLFYDAAYKNKNNFFEAVSFRDIQYRNVNQKVIKVRNLILQIIARYGTGKLVQIMLIDFRDNLAAVFGAIAMGVFMDNIDVLRAIIDRYGWINTWLLAGYARSLPMIHWLRNRIPFPKQPDGNVMYTIIEKFCEHDADEVLHEYVKDHVSNPVYFAKFRLNVLEISSMHGAKKIMKRYIVGASEDEVKSAIDHSLISPNICTEWLWKHEREMFTQMMKTQPMQYILDEYRLAGVIWLMEHGVMLTSNQMAYIDEVELDYDDHSERIAKQFSKIKELYAAQNK